MLVLLIEYVPCEDCKDGKKGCKDCGDVAIVDEPKKRVPISIEDNIKDEKTVPKQSSKKKVTKK